MISSGKITLEGQLSTTDVTKKTLSKSSKSRGSHNGEFSGIGKWGKSRFFELLVNFLCGGLEFMVDEMLPS